MISFVKMHGCGNDFVVVRHRELEEYGLEGSAFVPFVRRVCDRHRGIGADGLLTYATEEGGSPAVRMRYWNSDGSRAEMCGNGARCVVRLACERRETTSPLDLVTDAGRHRAQTRSEGGHVRSVRIQMGPVRWEPDEIGLHEKHTLVDAALQVGEQELRVTTLSLGNPHAVVFMADTEALQRLALENIGPSLATHPIFTRGANASFATLTREGIRVRVWERGAGPTLACGSAACAVVAAARRLGHLDSDAAAVYLPGGRVEVESDAAGEIWLEGPAAFVAEGSLSAELLTDDEPR
ncbi:MAG: diaminopimelate epimerase [Candidatus Latescibacterota bacterium]|nr:MAG: diaminopimelate epimerase [Candidatus Latescibacterota bacterium]